MPLYPILCHSIPFYPIMSHYIPLYPILCHSIPFYAILSHSIPLCPIISHYIPFYAILSHFMPLYPILCHSIPFYAILSHYVPLYPILCHSIPLYPKICAILSYCISRVFGWWKHLAEIPRRWQLLVGNFGDGLGLLISVAIAYLIGGHRWSRWNVGGFKTYPWGVPARHGGTPLSLDGFEIFWMENPTKLDDN